MNNDFNEEFDPRKFTAKELLKQLLIKQEETDAKVVQMSKEIETLKTDLEKRSVLAEDKEKRKSFGIAIAGLLGGVFMWIVQTLYELLKQ